MFPTLTEPLLSREALRARVGDDAAWEALVERPLGEVLTRYFEDDFERGIIATDALIGTFAGLDDESLRQNRCFLYHVIGNGTGDWDVPVGGMGALTESLAGIAYAAGAEIRLGVEVTSIETDGVGAEVRFEGGSVAARHVLSNAAPAVLARLLGEPEPDPPPEGAQLKLNLLLKRLPRLRDPSVDPREAFAGTFHVNESATQLALAYGQAQRGQVPELAPCEVYCHSLTDPTILGARAARGGGADADLLRAAHAGAAVRARARRRPRREAIKSTLRVAEQRARRADRGLPVDRAVRRAVPGGAHAGRARGRARACRAGTSSTATCCGRSPRTRPRSAPGASRPRTTTCSSAARARGAAAASPASPGHNAAMKVLSSRT